MYRVFQFFVLSLKIDIFTGFMVSIFYLIQFSLKQGITWESIIQVIVTIFILPMLYFARHSVSIESKARMIIFIIFECLVLFHFALIFSQTLQPNNNWYVWICFSKYTHNTHYIKILTSNYFYIIVWIGVAFTLVTCILSIICMRNFGKGLKPFVQRGSVKTRIDLEKNTARDQNNRQSWRIDDD